MIAFALTSPDTTKTISPLHSRIAALRTQLLARGLICPADEDPTTYHGPMASVMAGAPDLVERHRTRLIGHGDGAAGVKSWRTVVRSWVPVWSLRVAQCYAPSYAGPHIVWPRRIVDWVLTGWQPTNGACAIRLLRDSDRADAQGWLRALDGREDLRALLERGYDTGEVIAMLTGDASHIR